MLSIPISNQIASFKVLKDCFANFIKYFMISSKKGRPRSLALSMEEMVCIYLNNNNLLS